MSFNWIDFLYLSCLDGKAVRRGPEMLRAGVGILFLRGPLTRVQRKAYRSESRHWTPGSFESPSVAEPRYKYASDGAIYGQR